jgi:murein endopeptidase
MRSFATLFALLALTASADARPRKKREARTQEVKHTTKHAQHAVKHTVRGPIIGQSVGVPWNGELHAATALPEGEGYVIRHPSRRFGTQTTVDFVEQAIAETREAFPDAHVLAIGDISAEHGGAITQHHSHQSGRDIDVGLFYVDKPAGYPENFVRATADNLDFAATFKLLLSFADTASEEGGAQLIFLDYDVQGLLYHWALDHGYSDDRLDRLFQFPHGRGSSEGLVRHWANHDTHMHVRFKCPSGDEACQ